MQTENREVVWYYVRVRSAEALYLAAFYAPPEPTVASKKMRRPIGSPAVPSAFVSHQRSLDAYSVGASLSVVLRVWSQMLTQGTRVEAHTCRGRAAPRRARQRTGARRHPRRAAAHRPLRSCRASVRGASGARAAGRTSTDPRVCTSVSARSRHSRSTARTRTAPGGSAHPPQSGARTPAARPAYAAARGTCRVQRTRAGPHGAPA
jgi:hypothetical protein